MRSYMRSSRLLFPRPGRKFLGVDARSLFALPVVRSPPRPLCHTWLTLRFNSTSTDQKSGDEIKKTRIALQEEIKQLTSRLNEANQTLDSLPPPMETKMDRLVVKLTPVASVLGIIGVAIYVVVGGIIFCSMMPSGGGMLDGIVLPFAVFGAVVWPIALLMNLAFASWDYVCATCKKLVQ